MKEYIVISILNNSLTFNYRSVSLEESVFVNKNTQYKDSFFYTLKYYKNHTKKICEKIKSLNLELNTFKILRLVTFKYTIELIETLNLENLVLEFLSTIDLDDYDLFLESKCIKNVYCYYMPEIAKAKFKNKGVNVYTSQLKEITDSFMKQQDVFNTDTLYYKNVIKVTEEYPELLDDLKEFLKINYNLKAIHIYVYSKELIQSIVNLVKNDESRNVIVFLHQEYDKGNFIVGNFEWLRELSDKCKEDYTCEFRIVYSNSFLKNNLFKQLTFNNLKLISVLCVYVCIVSLIIIKAYDYIEEVSVEQLRSQIVSDGYIGDSFDGGSEGQDGSNGSSSNYDDLADPSIDMEEDISKEELQAKYTFSNSFKALKKINKETKAYLTVKNTEISYPVVQHSDNNYYLKYDFYKKKSSMGWIYFDYRNSGNKLDDNNIIYGHSMKNGTMFGTLFRVLNSSWRKNKENMIINLDTETQHYKFKIFSTYKVDYTTDYLKVKFDGTEEKENFIKLIRGRSIFRSDEEVTVNDKILTLSTCTGGSNRRLVVHAVLMKEKKEEKEEKKDDKK